MKFQIIKLFENLYSVIGVYPMNEKGQAQMTTMVVGALVFLIVLLIFGKIYVTMNFTELFGEDIAGIIELLPWVLVGGAIIIVVLYAFGRFV